jgi:hypothetical protein
VDLQKNAVFCYYSDVWNWIVQWNWYYIFIQNNILKTVSMHRPMSSLAIHEKEVLGKL